MQLVKDAIKEWKIRKEVLYLVYLVVPGNVLVQCSQHNHGHHAREEEHNDQRVHDASQNAGGKGH